MEVEKSDLQASLEESLVRHNVPGASMAILHKGDLTTAAAGVINVNTGVAVTPETLMHVGSITKVINATLVMQLVDEGMVDLDERVLRYLPDLRLEDREALEQITVKMLLDHTSGIDGAWLPDYGHDEETIEKAFMRFAHLGQLFRPGAEWSYCNVAAVIAGYLVQRVRGRSWYRVIRERVFEPLQMKHATVLPEEALLQRASVGHYLDSATKNLTRTPFAFGPLSFAPAGSTAMISAADLIEFARAHVDQGVGTSGARILSVRSAKDMQRLTVDNKGKGYTWDLDMGLGWMLPGDGLLSHAGGGPGVMSVLYAHAECEWVAAVLTNAAHGWKVVNEMMEPWLNRIGTTKPLGMVDIQPPSEHVDIDCSKYVGVYEDVLTRFHISETQNGLALSRQKKFIDCEISATEATQFAGLTPLGNEQFLLEVNDTSDELPASRVFTFRNPDAKGRMRHLGTGSLHRRVS